MPALYSMSCNKAICPCSRMIVFSLVQGLPPIFYRLLFPVQYFAALPFLCLSPILLLAYSRVNTKHPLIPFHAHPAFFFVSRVALSLPADCSLHRSFPI